MHATPHPPSFENYGGSAPENYERYFVPTIAAPLVPDLLDRAALQPGERVLDLACGTGVVARAAADRVGPDGSVAGVDVNPGMLQVARSVAPPGAPIDWYEASAEDLPMPDGSRDAVLCQMGLQFFSDKAAALCESLRVLAPGGRMVASLPGPTPPPFRALDEALARHIHPDVAGFVEAVFSLHEPERLRALFEEAGFEEVAVDRTVQPLRLPPPRDFLWQYVHATPLGDAVAKAGEDRRAALEREVVAAWEPFTRDGRLAGEVGMVYATGRKA